MSVELGGVGDRGVGLLGTLGSESLEVVEISMVSTPRREPSSAWLISTVTSDPDMRERMEARLRALQEIVGVR